MVKKITYLLIVFLSSVLFLTSCEGRGKLQIDNPPGADVYVDGQKVGKTPLLIELKEGRYDITVATTEFDRETKKGVWIYYDKVTKIDFNPKPTGLLKADTIPQGAVVIDGKYQVGTTPFREYLPVGKHVIVFKLGAVGTSRKVIIEYGKEVTLNVNLQKAVLHFDANMPDATLYIDGKQTGGFPQTVELEEGIHKFTVEKEIYKDEFNLKVKKGDELKISFNLQELQLPNVGAYGPLMFTADYSQFISLGKAGVYFWNTNDLKPHVSLWDPDDARNLDKFSNFAVSDDGKLTAAIKPIKALAYKYKDTKNPLKVLVWDNTTTAIKLNKLLDFNAEFVAFGNGGKSLYLIDRIGKISVIEFPSGNKIGEFSTGDGITAVKANSGKIYLGTSSGKVLILDTASNSITNQINLHTGAVNDLQLSKDRSQLITASSDKTVKIVKLPDMSVARTINTTAPVMSANISPSAGKVIVGKVDRTADVLSADGSKMYTISLNYIPTSVGFLGEETTITAGSKESPTVNLWYQGHLLKKWIQVIE